MIEREKFFRVNENMLLRVFQLILLDRDSVKLVEVKSLRTAICSLPRTEFSSSYAPRYFILVTPLFTFFPPFFLLLGQMF